MSNNSRQGSAFANTPSGIPSQIVGDVRLHSVGWLEAIDCQRLAEPKQYTQSAWAQVNGAEVSFPAPSGVALHLNAAWRSAPRCSGQAKHSLDHGAGPIRNVRHG